MSNLNFFDPDLHQLIKRNADDLRIHILPYEGPADEHPTQTKFKIGDYLITADTSPEEFYHYLLKPMLTHFPNQVMIDDRPLQRRPFEPQVQHIYHTFPSPLEQRLFTKGTDFSQFHDVGVIIDGITYLPPHPIWDYQVTDQHPRHPHWTGIVEIAVYPFVDLGNPTNIDPCHPENIAEVLSQTLAPQYQVPDWMSRQRCPDPNAVYHTWAPQHAGIPWMPQSIPIIVSGTPTLIEVEDQTLAFTIAHALFNQPELGLVPVLEPKTGQDHITLTCPDPQAITAAGLDGRTHSLRASFPPPDGPLRQISIPCHADGQPIIVNPCALFIEDHDKHLVYSTGRQSIAENTLAFMAASAFARDSRSPKSPGDFMPHAIQALHGSTQAHHHLMMSKAAELDALRQKLTPPAHPIQADYQEWTILYQPEKHPKHE